MLKYNVKYENYTLKYYLKLNRFIENIAAAASFTEAAASLKDLYKID
ncbi:MAG: hypothetical protein GXO74_01365 [Calditrichaeota bacterium]|nr:hypothetical protein [Calditrichota bacterium]